MTTEYITIGTHAHLIGKRARFKNNLSTYCSSLWLKEGVIIQHEGVEHVGLSLKFDKGLNNKENNWGLDTCYIRPGSIEIFEE